MTCLANTDELRRERTVILPITVFTPKTNRPRNAGSRSRRTFFLCAAAVVAGALAWLWEVVK